MVVANCENYSWEFGVVGIIMNCNISNIKTYFFVAPPFVNISFVGWHLISENHLKNMPH